MSRAYRSPNSPQTGDTYGRGEEAVVSVAFSGTGVSVEGAPTLKLKIGSVEREAAYLQTDANANALQFRYTIQASDVDTDGISVEAGALSVGAAATIRDSGGRNAVLALGVHAIANSASHKANGGITRAPTVLGATLITAPALGDTFKRGEGDRDSRGIQPGGQRKRLAHAWACHRKRHPAGCLRRRRLKPATPLFPLRRSGGGRG